MSIISRLLAKYFKLPPAETCNVAVEANIAVPMPDEVTLLADRYYPRDGEKRPLLLVRTPYGRTGLIGLLYGRLFAERGFQVLIQSCRGTEPRQWRTAGNSNNLKSGGTNNFS